MDPKRVAYIQEVCNQIKDVSSTIGQTIKHIGYVGKNKALPPASIVIPVEARSTQHLYMGNESVRSLTDQLTATQLKVDQLERELLKARLALADRTSSRQPSPRPSNVGNEDMTWKLLCMQEEINKMIDQTTGVAITH